MKFRRSSKPLFLTFSDDIVPDFWCDTVLLSWIFAKVLRLFTTTMQLASQKRHSKSIVTAVRDLRRFEFLSTSSNDQVFIHNEERAKFSRNFQHSPSTVHAPRKLKTFMRLAQCPTVTGGDPAVPGYQTWNAKR
uniref:Uncharacterized protein n=1 Tax=Ascaris lumbricoides TaxID=6252 RepID=A0A0M3I3N6_ASCLU